MATTKPPGVGVVPCRLLYMSHHKTTELVVVLVGVMAGRLG